MTWIKWTVFQNELRPNLTCYKKKMDTVDDTKQRFNHLALKEVAG